MKKHRIWLVLLIALIAIMALPLTAEAKVKINKKKATIQVGKTVQLKVTGTKKKVTWSSSKKKVATVSSKGKVTGKSAGKTVITAKVGGKKYKCTVTVKAPGVGSSEAEGYVIHITHDGEYPVKYTVTWDEISSGYDKDGNPILGHKAWDQNGNYVPPATKAGFDVYINLPSNACNLCIKAEGEGFLGRWNALIDEKNVPLKREIKVRTSGAFLSEKGEVI